jgi:hypothetical protein
MKNLSYWEQFMGSGKIDDYLSYASYEDRERSPENQKQWNRTLGANTYAGIRMCDRNHTETSTYRGI